MKKGANLLQRINKALKGRQDNIGGFNLHVQVRSLHQSPVTADPTEPEYIGGFNLHVQVKSPVLRNQGAAS